MRKYRIIAVARSLQVIGVAFAHTIRMKTRSFGRSAAVLAVIGIVAKLIGALYRVPLTNIVGAEGMGLYQMVFPLYTVLLAFCGGGAVSAVSRVVAKYTALGDDKTAGRAARAAFIPLGATSAVAAVAVALLRNVISGIQGNTDAGVAYLALAPSLLFAGGISVLRGYFQGKSNMTPSGVSQLIEQVIKLLLGLGLSRILIGRGVRFAVAGALIGVSASEFVALAYLALRALIARKKRIVRTTRPELATEAATDAVIVTDRELLKELYSFALPVTLGSLVLPITQMIDSVLVINLLIGGGAGREYATALFGLFVGPVGTLVNMPSVVVLSFAVAFLPALTSAVERGDGGAETVRAATKWIMLFAIPMTAAFMLFPDRICGTLYRRGLTAEQLETAARLLRIQGIAVFYSGVLQLGTTVLQANNKAHLPVINLVIGACVKVALTPLLVRAFGIIGAAGATAAFYAVAATLTVRRAYKQSAIGADILRAFILPTVFAAVACAAFVGGVYLSRALSLAYLWQNVVGAALFVICYVAGVIATGVIDIKSTIAEIKNGRAVRRSKKVSGKSRK